MNDEELYKKLREPFTINFINWKINNLNTAKTKAMITFYLDARAVQHRLNRVLGVDGWDFTFTELEKDNGVHGKLTIYTYSEEDRKTKPKEDCIINKVTREDVGYATPTEKSEWYKDAVSDALKRCAVHFGVGHFLYALPYLWIDLASPNQKFLNEDQNEYIRNWLTQQLEKMTSKSSSKVSKK